MVWQLVSQFYQKSYIWYSMCLLASGFLHNTSQECRVDYPAPPSFRIIELGHQPRTVNLYSGPPMLFYCLWYQTFFAKSLRNKLKSNGLSMHPWRTPISMSKKLLRDCPIFTHALSVVYRCLMILKNFPVIPKFKIFWSRRSLGTESKAFLKSTKQL